MFLDSKYIAKTQWWRFLIVISFICGLLYNKTKFIDFQNNWIANFTETYLLDNTNSILFQHYTIYLLCIIAFELCVRIFQKSNTTIFISKPQKFRYLNFFLGTFLLSLFQVASIIVKFSSNPNYYEFQFDFYPFLQLFIVGLIGVLLKVFFYGIILSYIFSFFNSLIKKRHLSILFSSLMFTFLLFFIECKCISPFQDIITHRGFYIILVSMFLTILILLNDGIELAMGLLFTNNFLHLIFNSTDNYGEHTAALFKVTTTQTNILTDYYLALSLYFVYIITTIKVFKIYNWKQQIFGETKG